jgi:predicted alpha/beta hydrolase family esterase
MLTRLADRLILCPTTHPIPAGEKRREVWHFDDGQFEVWIQNTGQTKEQIHLDLFVLKFPGTGGRAERMSEHPAEVWSDLAAEVWTVNPPGYGGSGGRASLGYVTAVADAAWAQISARASGKPIIVTGNSLGCLAAFHLAASKHFAGLLVRNPPSLRELIAGRHGWWNLGFSKLIAAQVPESLCSISNATRANVPAVFVMSEKDRTVPPSYQRRIINAYAGEQRLMVLRDADHTTPIDESQVPEYLEVLNWFRQALLQYQAEQYGSLLVSADEA